MLHIMSVHLSTSLDREFRSVRAVRVETACHLRHGDEPGRAAVVSEAAGYADAFLAITSREPPAREEPANVRFVQVAGETYVMTATFLYREPDPPVPVIVPAG